MKTHYKAGPAKALCACNTNELTTDPRLVTCLSCRRSLRIRGWSKPQIQSIVNRVCRTRAARSGLGRDGMIVNGCAMPEDAVVLDTGRNPSNQEPYVIWAVPFNPAGHPPGWKGQPAVVLQIAEATAGVKAGTMLTLENLRQLVRAIGDACEVCLGLKGGVRGNENRIHGLRMCDYCYARLGDLLQPEPR